MCINTRQFHGEEQGERKNNGDEQCPKLPFQNCSMDFFSLDVKILKKAVFIISELVSVDYKCVAIFCVFVDSLYVQMM